MSIASMMMEINSIKVKMTTAAPCARVDLAIALLALQDSLIAALLAASLNDKQAKAA